MSDRMNASAQGNLPNSDTRKIVLTGTAATVRPENETVVADRLGGRIVVIRATTAAGIPVE